MIEVQNLTKKYGSHLAVDNLSFQVDKGMIYGFLGPNGAGKSTTMNIMTGYIAATDGTVRINGYDILKEPEKAKKCIGYLPELPPVYPDMTVYEYLKFAAEIKQIKKAQRNGQIESVMEQTQIADVQNRLIKNLSKGYKQRVGLAQAILGEPEVIILDEPTVGLDPKQIIEIRELIRTLSDKHTILLSSHILSEVSAVCDHILIISKGKLAASGTPEELMTLLKGGKQLEITVLGEQERFENILKEMDEVESFHVETGAKEGELHGLVRFAAEKDIRKELFYRLAASDMPIMSLGLSEKSLEDVFLELTDEGKGESGNDGNL
ncbi:MAG: ABC transporter ATP-binding protein [Lachnospiraceae bacterium]|nr:ABC transporter ATP-binding protein [Lachnospiraceae bacterium]